MAIKTIKDFSEPIQKEVKFWTGLLEKYVGWTIDAPFYFVEESGGLGDVYIGFRMRSPDKIKFKDVWFLTDEEGNGAGRFNAIELM